MYPTKSSETYWLDGWEWWWTCLAHASATSLEEYRQHCHSYKRSYILWNSRKERL